MIFERFDVLRYIKDYKFNSIFIKNLILLVLLMVVPFSVITFVSYSVYNRILQNEISNGNMNSLLKVRDTIENILDECKRQTNWSAFDKDIELFMHTAAEEDLVFYNQANINQLINANLLSKEYYDSIYIYSERNNQVISSRGKDELNQFIDNGWHQSYIKNKNKFKLWVEVRKKNDYGSEANKKLISIFKIVNYGPESKGVIIFNIDAQNLGDQLNSSSEMSNETITILDKKGNYVYNNKESLKILTEISLAKSFFNEKNKFMKIIGKGPNKKIISGIISNQSGWKYISSVYLSFYEKNVKGLRMIMILIVFFSFIFTIFISFFISVKTFNPIKQIISTINQPENLLTNAKETKTKHGELKYIIESLTNSVHKEKTMSEELQSRIELLKKSQAVALQSQINPHFFHNTLETINWMAMKLTGGKNEVSKMITSLSEMLRLSLENTDRLIPLCLEKEHVCKYIEIQKFRYDDKFEVIWNIPEEVSQCKVIKITLQPIVENAIYHGIKPMVGKGRINITAYTIESILYIEVRDNGVGLSEEDIEKLNEQMKNEFIKENEHLGLMNVNQRIKLFFGEGYGVRIENSKISGTVVKISMPEII